MLPVTVVTGFLGSGKTTLINDLVRDPAFRRSAVLVNELGDVAVDHDLIARIEDGVVETTTGCICCAAESDVTVSLDRLADRVARGEIRPLERIIIETTGLADPAPVVTALLPPAPHSQQYRLSSVVTLFDIVTGGSALDDHFEAIKQVALADAVVLTKTDLATDPATLRDVARDRDRLAGLNPGAAILDRQSDVSTIKEILLRRGGYDVDRLSEDALGWLAAEQAGGHGHGPHSQDDRHGGVASHCIVQEQPLDPRGFSLFLEALKLSAGAKIIRIKGLVALADDPDRPLIIHGVQHMIHPLTRLDRWPSEDRRTRLVLIGRELKSAPIERMLATLKPKRLA